MGYYTRVFCSSKEKPKINGILESLKAKGFKVRVNLDKSALNDTNWTSFELTYAEGKSPLLIEINEKGKSDGIAEEEIEEFLEFIGKPKLYELKKKKVLNHLKQTEFIICIQLPTTDFIDLGYDVNGDLMEYIAEEFSGIVQADGEGFYEKNKLIVELE